MSGSDKEAVMIRAAIFAFAAIAGLHGGIQPVAAREAPWCAVISSTDDSVYWDCQYYSFEQCRSVVLAGNRGWCNPSPYATPGAEDSKRKPRKSHGS
jgi:hypothetical protein